MKQSSQKFTYTFPGNAPTELKADPFLGAKILQHVDDWIFREAERWPHPWRFLLDVRRLPSAAYDLFQAAESASHAQSRLLKMSYGGATLQRDLIEEMEKQERAGNGAAVKRLGLKLTTQFLRYDRWPKISSIPMPDETRREIESLKDQAERALIKRHGREEGLARLPLPTAVDCDPVHALLVWNWLRWGTLGEPGLCYYSDEALADLIVLLLGRENRQGLGTQTAYYRKLRQRLGLEQAYYRKPLVIKARRVQRNVIEIELKSREGTHRHTLSNGQRMVIAGRQYYPLS